MPTIQKLIKNMVTNGIGYHNDHPRPVDYIESLRDLGLRILGHLDYPEKAFF